MADEQVGQSHIGADAANAVEVRLRPDQYSRYNELANREGISIGEVVLRELEAHEDESAPHVLRNERNQQFEGDDKLRREGFALGFTVGTVLTGMIFAVLRLVRRK